MPASVQLQTKQKNHILRWNGSIGNDVFLMSLSGHESVSAPFHYQLRSLTTRGERGIAALHGSAVSCQIGDGLQNQPQRHVHGIITHIHYEQSANNHALCIFTLEPVFALLGMGKSMRVWQNITVPDLVRDLLSERNLDKVDIRLHNTYQKREYCIQYRESDFDFISRLLEEEGIYYFFMHQENQHTLVLADHPAGHQKASAATFPWHAQGQSISKWSSHSVLCPGKVTLSGYNEQQATGVAGQSSSVSENQCVTSVHYRDITMLKDTPLLERKAKSVMDAYDANTTLYHATVSAYWLYCGEVFNLTDHPTDNGDYRIQMINIHVENNFEDGPGTYQCELSALHNNVIWHPVCKHKMPEITGVLIATVVGPQSEEIHTDEYGRIKIQFPWNSEYQSDDTSSCWVRVSQMWAGSRFGSQFLPRVGNEVLVSFIQGNPDFPLVTGTVYNGKNKPPFTLPDEKNESGFASRSVKEGNIEEGHRLSFNDSKGEEKLTIASQKDFLLTVKNAVKSKIGVGRDTEITKGNDTLELKEGNYILTASNGAGRIKTSEVCVIESEKSVELIVGSSKIEISEAGIVISGKQIEIKGEESALLNSKNTTVEGSLQTKIDGKLIHIG